MKPRNPRPHFSVHFSFFQMENSPTSVRILHFIIQHCFVVVKSPCQGRLVVEVSRSHTQLYIYTHTRTQPVGLLWMSDQPVAEAATYNTHNKLKRRTPKSSLGFETAVPAIQRLQTYFLDHTVIGVDGGFITPTKLLISAIRKSSKA